MELVLISILSKTILSPGQIRFDATNERSNEHDDKPGLFGHGRGMQPNCKREEHLWAEITEKGSQTSGHFPKVKMPLLSQRVF